jgi:hypothetical protein
MLDVAKETFVWCSEKEKKRKLEDQFRESQKGVIHKFFPTLTNARVNQDQIFLKSLKHYI